MIYKYTFIDLNRHTMSLIQSSMIINQTMIELFDIRYAQNYILNEDLRSSAHLLFLLFYFNKVRKKIMSVM